MFLFVFFYYTHIQNSKTSSRASLPVVSDDRSNLLDQIKRGRELKHVEPGAGGAGSGGGGGGGGGDLLSEIRKGKQLRPVSDDPSSDRGPPQPELTGEWESDVAA